jgi:hypothetical protein
MIRIALSDYCGYAGSRKSNYWKSGRLVNFLYPLPGNQIFLGPLWK